jgi:hypothetical protein
MDFHRKTQRALNRPEAARTVGDVDAARAGEALLRHLPRGDDSV